MLKRSIIITPLMISGAFLIVVGEEGWPGEGLEMMSWSSSDRGRLQNFL